MALEEVEAEQLEDRAAAAAAIATAMATTTTMAALAQLDQLDASLDDFAPSMGSPRPRPLPFGYPSAHSGFRSDDTESETGASDSAASAGGYSPPAWRRLGNGDRSNGFWRKGDELMMMYDGDDDDDEEIGRSRESSPEYESADEGNEILEQAIRTRLPTGSLSPEKERSPEPEYHLARQYMIDDAIAVKHEDNRSDLALSELRDGILKSKEVADNCKWLKWSLSLSLGPSPRLTARELFDSPSGPRFNTELSPSKWPSIPSAAKSTQ